jgi:hypothetical protein
MMSSSSRFSINRQESQREPVTCAGTAQESDAERAFTLLFVQVRGFLVFMSILCRKRDLNKKSCSPCKQMSRTNVSRYVCVLARAETGNEALKMKLCFTICFTICLFCFVSLKFYFVCLFIGPDLDGNRGTSTTSEHFGTLYFYWPKQEEPFLRARSFATQLSSSLLSKNLRLLKKIHCQHQRLKTLLAERIHSRERSG